MSSEHGNLAAGPEFQRLAEKALSVDWPPCLSCKHARNDHAVDLEGLAFCETSGCRCEHYHGPDVREIIRAQVADALAKLAGLPAEGGVPGVTQYGADQNGGRSCGFRVGEVSVLVRPSDAEANDLALATAKKYAAGEGYCDTCGGGHGLTTNPICVGCDAALRERQTSASPGEELEDFGKKTLAREPALGSLTNEEIHDILTMTLHGPLPHKTMLKVFASLHELSELRKGR